VTHYVHFDKELKTKLLVPAGRQALELKVV